MFDLKFRKSDLIVCCLVLPFFKRKTDKIDKKNIS